MCACMCGCVSGSRAVLKLPEGKDLFPSHQTSAPAAFFDFSLAGQSRHSVMINNPVLQGDMHSDTVIWREREEPKGAEFLCSLFTSQVRSAVQAVWEPHPTSSCLQPGEGP